MPGGGGPSALPAEARLGFGAVSAAGASARSGRASFGFSGRASLSMELSFSSTCRVVCDMSLTLSGAGAAISGLAVRVLRHGGGDSRLLGGLDRVHRQARDLRDVVGIVRRHHVGVPGLRGEAAAGYPRHGREVVIAEPDAGDILAGEADEPGVAIGRAGSRLAGRVGVIELGRLAGSFQDHRLEHGVQLADHLRVEDLLARLLVAVAIIDELAGGERPDLLDGIRVHLEAAARRRSRSRRYARAASCRCRRARASRSS